MLEAYFDHYGKNCTMILCSIEQESTLLLMSLSLYYSVTPSISSLTYDDTAQTLTCVSTGSPATTVTWEKDGVPLSIDGSTYQLTQTVTDRTTSTYSNVLTVSETAPTGIAGIYTCNVSNQIGSVSNNFKVVGKV